MSEALGSQHTQSFPVFLEQAGISLVVSTYQAGKLIILRAQNKVLNTHFVDLQKPMGMALKEPKLVVGSGYQVISYYNMTDVAAKIEPANTHSGCYLPRQVHVTGDIDIHEMAIADDDEIWLVNTRMSCLCTLSPEHSVEPRWRPPFVSEYDLLDRCHLNGLAMRQGKPAYVTALGQTDRAGGWREGKASGGLIMEIESCQVITTGLSMPHSPRWYQDKLWVLESGAGTLATVDPNTGVLDTIVELPGFTRGLDFIGRYALVGLSQVRETAVFAGLPLTARCEERQCGVWIIDIVARQIVGFVIFSGVVQEVFAVQILPTAFPAILSQEDPLLRSSYSLPDQVLNEFSTPEPSQVLLEQATLLHRKEHFDEAITAYQEVLKQFPEHQVARYQLGVAYADDEMWQQAIEILEQVIEAQPTHAEALNSLGHSWAGLFKWEKAIECYESAIASDQQYATAHFNLSLILLRQGKYQQGWSEYEWRWHMPTFTPFRCPQPQWQGEAISDKTILVHTEQGNGDAIQFARFLPMLSDRVNKLIIVCTEPLRLFFKAFPCVNEVRLAGHIQADSFDVYCPLMSLPGLLGITLDNLPAQVPYWRVPQEAAVPGLKIDTIKVGLVWAGSPNQKINHHRSIDLESFISWIDPEFLNHVQFYSFQIPVSEESKQILGRSKIISLDSDLVSYAHTGALLSQMDLVITVCTSVAHLSGSLAVPTWVLISAYSDWRWLEQRDDSPWYPTLRLFRQSEPGDWSQVLRQVKEAFMLFLGNADY
ncbi:MAG: TIGR03032 family protein [Gammaproteobacteria bacterium]|nr:TIGR03032 family protein [Gammaproteobacteria bacterium]